MKIVIDLTPPNGHGFSIAHEESEPDLIGPMRPVGDEIVVRFDGREMSAGAFRSWARRLAEVELSTDPAHAGEVTRLREVFRSEQEMAAAVVTALSAQITSGDRRITELEEELAAVALLHGKDEAFYAEQGWAYCLTCTDDMWPCATAQAAGVKR